MHWDYVLITVFSVRSSFTFLLLLWNAVRSNSFHFLPWIPFLFCILCFYKFKKRVIIPKHGNKQKKHLKWSVSLNTLVFFLMSLAVLSIYILGPEPEWYFCDVILPSDLLNKQAFSVTPLNTDLTMTLRQSLPLCIPAMQISLYSSECIKTGYNLYLNLVYEIVPLVFGLQSIL